MQVLPVYAAEPAAALSVWDFMITELVGANCIITDSAVLSAYGSALGSLNAATATAAEIDAAIATAAVNCGVDLSNVFANTASAAASIGLENAAAATAGENLAATCSGYFAAGEGSAVIPAIAQTCLDVLGVAGIVAGIAYICNMAADDFGDLIKYSGELDQLSELANMDFSNITMTGYGGLWTCRDGRNLYYGFGYIQGHGAYYVNTSNSATSIQWTMLTDHVVSANIPAKSVEKYYSNSNGYAKWQGMPLPSSNINSFIGKTPALPTTKSIASSNGFQKYDPDYNSENNPDVVVPNFPELKPLSEYQNGYGLNPISADDYNALVNQLNSLDVPWNNELQEDSDDDVAQIVQPLISPHIVPLPEVNPNPDPQPTGTPDPQPTGSPDPQPTGSPNPKPNTNPFPDPETVPQVTPVVNPTPDSEIAPAPVPYPDPETPTEQDKTDTDTKITPIDLRDKFPFCIPFDMLKIMKLFQGGREAPCFTWEIPFGIAGSGSVTVDLAPWDDVATLMRTLELILFIMLLAVGTRNLLGGSS